MRSRLYLLPLLLSLAALAAGCSLVTDFDDFEIQTDEAFFLEEARGALCERLLRCEPKFFPAAFAEPVCHPTEGGRVLLALTQYVPGTVEFDSELGEACLDELRNTDCSIQNGLFGDSCEAMLVGTLAAGEVCLTDTQCLNGFCLEATDACGGECVQKGTTDDPCARDGHCATGYWCGPGSTCRPRGALGDPCAANSHCENLYWCDTGINSCANLPNIGDACVYQLDGDICRGSLVCTQIGAANWQCATGAAEGESCDAVAAPCQPGFRCSGADVCVPLVGDGGPCESVENCSVGFECVADLCTPLPTLGDACSPTLPCVQGACVDGACAQLPAGAPCSGVNEEFFGLLAECEGYCDDLGMMMRVCADAIADGQSCGADHECADASECLNPGTGSVCTSCD